MTSAYKNAVDAELLSIQRSIAEYAQRHPRIAARLRHGDTIGNDPEVGRLVQAFALLAARTRCRIEDSFPEIIEPLLDLTSQRYSTEVPSLAIAELILNPDQPPDAGGLVVPRGTELTMGTGEGFLCRFLTTAETSLSPIILTSVSVAFPPFTSQGPESIAASCAIRLQLETMAGNIALDSLKLDRLRFFIHADLDQALRIHECIFRRSLAVHISGSDGPSTSLPPESLALCGFASEERLLDSFGQPDGERMVCEFLRFPEKFLFFELTGTEQAFSRLKGTSAEIWIMLNVPPADISKHLANDSIRLNCVPIANQFSMDAAPVEIEQNENSVSLTVDLRNPGSHRIHRVEHLKLQEKDGSAKAIPGYHETGHALAEVDETVYWTQTKGTSDGEAGVRFMLSSGSPSDALVGVVNVTATCSNGNFPNQLWNEERHRILQPATPGAFSEVRLLTRPTLSQPEVPLAAAWRIVARSLPEFSQSDEDVGQGVRRLRELFKLLGQPSNSLVAGMADTIESVQIQRVPGICRQRMICHGLAIHVTLNEQKSVSGGLFLFAEVVRRFLARYATAHTFIRFRVTTTTGKDYGEWPITDGERFTM